MHVDRKIGSIADMIDLCVDTRMATFSGIGTYIREMLPHFRKTFWRVTLIVDQVGHDWARGFDQIVLNAPIYSIREQILYAMKIPACDLLFSPHYNVPIFPVKAKKYVVTIHDVCHLVHGTSLQKAYAKILMKRALQCERVITVSEFSKSEIRKYFGTIPIDVIPIAVNHRRFRELPVSNAIREKYQLPNRFVLFIGNQKPHKNIEALKKAFLKVDVPGLKLVIAGKGTPFGKIDDTDLPYLYSMAEAFVFPSKYEGFGLPPIEAMSAGCPTIVSKAASIPEVCGDASAYFDPDNTDEMANAIRKVVTDDEFKKELIRKGHERVKDLSWKKTAEMHLKIFEEVCGA